MASKRRQRRNACEGKIQHPTRDAALAHSTGLWRSGKGTTHVYHCKFGDHWHVGHPDKRKRQGFAAAKAHRLRYS